MIAICFDMQDSQLSRRNPRPPARLISRGSPSSTHTQESANSHGNKLGGGRSTPPANNDAADKKQETIAPKTPTTQAQQDTAAPLSSTCKPIVPKRPKIDLPSHRINARIQYMKDHALIGKFIGFWPTEKALQGWIASKWKPKGHVTLQLGPKGFFTAIFICIEDRNRVMDEGPYFFNSVGLYLRNWVERFNPDKENFNWAPVWIRLYSLPLEYWDEDSLQEIGKGLGEFIKIAEETKLRRYTSYARIYVYMHLDKALPNAVSIYHDDFEWIQPLDYEHVPFRCPRCHAHGHLFRDCPLNAQAQNKEADVNPEADGFTKVPTRRQHSKKPSATGKKSTPSSNAPSTSNSFAILSNSDPTSDSGQIPSNPHQQPSDSSIPTAQPNPLHSQKEKASTTSPSTNPFTETKLLTWHPEIMEVDDPKSRPIASDEENLSSSQLNPMEEDSEGLELGELDIIGLEDACKSKDFDKIKPHQIDKLVKVLPKAQQQTKLGIQLGSHWDSLKVAKESRKRGRKPDWQRTITIGEILVNSGRYPKLTWFFKPLPNSSS